MSFHDLMLILVGACATILLLVILVFARALILRRHRNRLTAQAWRVPTSRLPQAVPGVIEEIRREADEAYQEHLKRQEAERQRRLEIDWRRDGMIMLKPKRLSRGAS